MWRNPSELSINSGADKFQAIDYDVSFYNLRLTKTKSFFHLLPELFLTIQTKCLITTFLQTLDVAPRALSVSFAVFFAVLASTSRKTPPRFLAINNKAFFFAAFESTSNWSTVYHHHPPIFPYIHTYGIMQHTLNRV